MGFTSAAFRRNRATDMALEIQAALADAQRLDGGCDTHVKRATRYTLAGCDWVAANIPGAARVLALIGGTVDELRAFAAVDALRDRKVAEACADAKALAGLLDGVDPHATPTSTLRAAVGGDSTATPAVAPTTVPA